MSPEEDLLGQVVAELRALRRLVGTVFLVAVAYLITATIVGALIR